MDEFIPIESGEHCEGPTENGESNKTSRRKIKNKKRLKLKNLGCLNNQKRREGDDEKISRTVMRRQGKRKETKRKMERSETEKGRRKCNGG